MKSFPLVFTMAVALLLANLSPATAADGDNQSDWLRQTFRPAAERITDREPRAPRAATQAKAAPRPAATRTASAQDDGSRPQKRTAVPAPRPTTAVTAPAKPAPKPAAVARRTPAPAASGPTLSGIASYYWQPQPVASGGRFNPDALTAAHKTLPFGTRVRVTRSDNGRSVEVVINDRGPYIAGRIIDLSRRAAQVIGMTDVGITKVNVAVLGR